MAYYLTEDEKYINGVTYAAGEIDVADNWVDVLAGSAGTLAENTTAYGELTYANRNLGTFADVDIYDLGVLSYGTYNISVDKHWWDYSATNIGYVNSFELLDSSGDSLKFQLLDTQDIVFSVAAPDTYYVKVKGSYSDTQYALSYTKTSNALDANIAATYSNVHINGAQAVGEVLTATSDIYDPNGSTGSSVIAFWYAYDGSDYVSLGSGASYTLAQGDVNKVIAVKFGFFDDAENFEMSDYYAYWDQIVVGPLLNNAPIVTSASSIDIGENTALDTDVYQVTATDADADALTYQLQGQYASYFNVDEQGIVSLTQLLDFESLPTFTVDVVVSDGKQPVAHTVTINVVDQNDVPNNVDVIAGSLKQNSILQVDLDSIDQDGVVASSVGYQWTFNGMDIAGALGASYEIQATDVGGLIGVRVSYTDGLGNETSIFSLADDIVAGINQLPDHLEMTDRYVSVGDNFTLEAANYLYDLDGPEDIFKYHFLYDYSWASIDPATGSISGTIPELEAGITFIDLTISAMDKGYRSTYDTMRLYIEQPQDPHVAVMIIDDFGYQSAIRSDVIYYDYDAEYEDGWDYYSLDSLEELADLQAYGYTQGFGAWRIVDENGSDSYSTFFDYQDVEKDTDGLVDTVDDDAEWDYYWWSYDEVNDTWVQHFTNDLDDLHSLPNIAEAESLGMLLPHYERFPDLDGAVDYFDPFDMDDYNKVDADPDWDYRFYFRDTIDPVSGTESYQYVDKSNIEVAKLAGDITTDVTHGDVVLDSYLDQLSAEYGDNVTFVLVDGWDETANDTNWSVNYLLENMEALFLDVESMHGIAKSDFEVVSLSFSTGSDKSASTIETYATVLDGSVIQAIPNDGKYANRYWDEFIETHLIAKPSVLHVGGVEEDLNADNVISDYESSMVGYELAQPYVDLRTSANNETYDWQGTSFATPTVAAAFTTLNLDMAKIGLGLDFLSVQESIALLTDKNGVLDYTDFTQLDGNRIHSVFGGMTRTVDINAAAVTDSLVLTGGLADDLIVGGLGDDDISIAEGADYVDGNSGDDVFTVTSTGTFSHGYAFNVGHSGQVGTGQFVALAGKTQVDVVVDGSEGLDTINLTDAGDAFFLHDAISKFHTDVVLSTDAMGRESVRRFEGLEVINGLLGDDIIDLTSCDYSMAGEATTINGGVGDDVIWASDGDDVIIGGEGADVLFGGAGNNSLTGGQGADQFQLTISSNNTQILDLDLTQGDTIAFYAENTFQYDQSSLQWIETNGLQLQVNYQFNDAVDGAANEVLTIDFDSAVMSASGDVLDAQDLLAQNVIEFV